MEDYITIDNLEVFANHGVLKEETSLGQKFLICGRLYFDMSRAGASDDIRDSVNYAEVCADITKYMSDNTFKLIEKVAHNIAIGLLKHHEILSKAEITVKKPWAPIGLPVDCVMVTVKRGWSRAYLSIGSNMGDKEENLSYAVSRLKEDEMIKDVKVSSFIKTKPYGNVEQDDFLNGAVALKTLYSPDMLLKKINEIEAERGRKRTIHWGPRTLDIDILLYEDMIINEENLIVPHPDMTNRSFVLDPLEEIAPYILHPVKRMNIKELNDVLKKNNPIA